MRHRRQYEFIQSLKDQVITITLTGEVSGEEVSLPVDVNLEFAFDYDNGKVVTNYAYLTEFNSFVFNEYVLETRQQIEEITVFKIAEL